MIKKILLPFFLASFFAFVSCADLGSELSNEGSLTLSKESFIMTNALGGATSETLTARLENYNAELEWFSADNQIVSIDKVEGFTAKVLAQGKAGTTKVGVRTKDGLLQAVCSVTVSLSKAPASPVTELSCDESSVTSSGFKLSWQPSLRASAVIIDLFESEEARNAGLDLAQNSSDTEPTVYKSYKVSNELDSYIVKDLITDSEGKAYYIAVYGYLNGKRSLLGQTASVKLLKDETAPSDVKDVASSVTDHSIVLSWTEPDDDDYAGVIVSLESPVTDFAGENLVDGVKTLTVAKGTTKASFYKLSSNTEHSFSFKTFDINGNVQGDTNNSDAGSTEKVSTAQDTSAPASVTEVSATFTVNGTVSVTWKNPSDVDFKEVIVSAVCKTDGVTAPASQTISAESSSANFSCSTDADYTFTVTTYDYDTNAGLAVSADAKKPLPELISVTPASYGSGLIARWTEAEIPSESEYSYKYQFLCYSDQELNTLAKTIDVPAGNSSWVLGSGLDYETSYYFVLQTYVSEKENESNNASYRSLVVKSATTPAKILVKTIQCTNTKAYIIPDADGKVKTLSSSSSNANYSSQWIVRPALDLTESYTYKGGNDGTTGTVETFSLEATDASGNPTGKYLYITNMADSNTGATDGSAVVLDQGSMSDKAKASFFKAYASWAEEGAKSIRSTYINGGFMLGSDSTSGALKYRYSLNVAGVNNWHWLFTY